MKLPKTLTRDFFVTRGRCRIRNIGRRDRRPKPGHQGKSSRKALAPSWKAHDHPMRKGPQAPGERAGMGG